VSHVRVFPRLGAASTLEDRRTMMTAFFRRRLPAPARPARWRALATAVIAAVLVLVAAAPAGAEPGEDDGAPPSLRDQLDIAARAYNEAKALLDASRARQAEIDGKLREAELRLTMLASQVGGVANAAYRGSRLSLATAVLQTGSDNLLRSATTVQWMAIRDDQKIRDYNRAKKEYAAQRKALEAEIKLQEEQTRQMEKRKDDAAKALAAAGGGGLVNGVPVPVPTAKPAPRNPDGSLPKETCSEDDPTTSGCITPRMLHAYTEARLAGFTRFTGCYRPGDRYEHPKGRACDFSANVSGFRDEAASGGDKNYGDRLAGWCVANASRLGVLYTIWYRQIWFPGLGWRAYSGGGSAAASHTNHVHLSIL
jgi:peptidoglycan DL-endopeptidase CwlO